MWIHRLIEIDASTRTGTYEHCGPVKLKRRRNKSGSLGWRCKEGFNRTRVNYRRYLTATKIAATTIRATLRRSAPTATV